MFITSDTRHAKYRDFARQQKDMPIYSKDWYLDAVYGDEWEVALVERNNEIVASLPYYLKKRGFFKYVSQRHLTYGMGPYIRPDFRLEGLEMKLMRELIERLPEFDHFEQAFSPQIENWLPFKWAGFQQSTSYTYVIEDITDPKKVWDGFHSNFRNRIKKAQNEVEIVTDRSLEDFYEVAQMTYKRQGLKTPYRFEELAQFDSRLYMESRSRIFFAQDPRGRLHSVLYTTLGDEYMHFHLAGENPGLRNSGAGMYLIWEAIKYASETEHLIGFDFQGSTVPSIEKVRRKSGAVRKPFFRIWKYNSNLFKLIRTVKGR